jgi:hypothetical protein
MSVNGVLVCWLRLLMEVEKISRLTGIIIIGRNLAADGY